MLVGLGTLLTEATPLHLAHGSERRTFTFAEAPLVVGMVISPGLAVLAGFVAAILVVQVARRLPLQKVAFNTAQYAAAAGLAVLLSVRVAGVPGALLGIVVFCLLNDVAVQLS